MRKIFKFGDQIVRKGVYWRVRDGEPVRMEKPGRLPSPPTERYARMHPLWLLLVGPFLGLAYVIFLPLIAIVMVVSLVSKPAARWLSHTLRHNPRLRWKPAEALVPGRRAGADNGADEEIEPPADA